MLGRQAAKASCLCRVILYTAVDNSMMMKVAIFDVSSGAVAGRLPTGQDVALQSHPGHDQRLHL